MKNAVTKAVAVCLLTGILFTTLTGCFAGKKGNVQDLSTSSATPSAEPAARQRPNLMYEKPELIDKYKILDCAENAAAQKYPEDVSGFGYIFNRTLISLYADTLDKKELLLGIYVTALTSREEYQIPDDITIDKEDLRFIMNIIGADAPELFHLDNEYKYYSQDERVTSIVFKYTIGADDYLRMLDATFSYLDNLLEFDSDVTDFDRELAVYGSIADNCVYKHGDYASCAYGAFIDGEAICEGYSDAFTLAMFTCGIPCFQVWGEAQNAEGDTESHAWNKVCIDGKWYNTDITWDDPKKEDYPPLYAYFNVTDEEMNRNHTSAEALESLALPACTDTDLNYHTYFGYMLSPDDNVADKITAALDDAVKNRRKNPSLMIKFETKESFTAFCDGIEKIIESWAHEQDAIHSVQYSYIFDKTVYVVYVDFGLEFR